MKRLLGYLPWLAVLIGLFVVLYSRTDIYGGDPDRYYHFAISRETAQAGQLYLDTVPQVVGLHWNKYFPDKEFLFHQLTLAGYKIGGDHGVAIAVLGVGVAVIVLLFLIAAEILSPWLAFLSAGIALCAPVLLFRLFLLRPHTLGIFTFLLVQWGLFSRRRYLLFGGAALFALSYHAFYLVLASIFLSLAAHALLDRKNWREQVRFHLWGIGGLAAGILLNPYFPSNIIQGWQIAKITSLVTDPHLKLAFGEELYPITSNIFLVRFFYPILVCLISGAIWIRNWSLRIQMKTAAIHLYSLLSLGIFLVLCAQSPRAGEYAIPAASLAFIFVLREPLLKKTSGRIAAGILFIAALIILIQTYRNQFRFYDQNIVTSNLNAATIIPVTKNNPHPMVYNCEWDRTPYLFYGRPEAKFLDLLDPSLLVIKNRPAAGVRELLKKGLVPDVRHLVSDGFHAQYVYCYSQNPVDQMRKDPSFRQLYPYKKEQVIAGHWMTHVFQVIPGVPPQFTRVFSWTEWKNASPDNYGVLTPKSAKANRRGIARLESTEYLNLGSELQQGDIPPGTARCATVSPRDIKTHLGAQYIGLGGGRNLRLWLNGKLLYASRKAFETVRTVQTLVSIPPLKSTDQIELAVCSGGLTPYWGVSLSFWTKGHLAKLCKEKANDHDPLEPPHRTTALYGQDPQETCIGPIAVPYSIQ